MTFKSAWASSSIQQGSLGNGYFINALRLLSCRPEYVKRILVSLPPPSTHPTPSLSTNYLTPLLRSLSHLQLRQVSEKYAEKGLYTVKFSKAGRWRYLHIDDRIACRPSGKVTLTLSRPLVAPYLTPRLTPRLSPRLTPRLTSRLTHRSYSTVVTRTLILPKP